jgi:hypothetical protein
MCTTTLGISNIIDRFSRFQGPTNATGFSRCKCMLLTQREIASSIIHSHLPFYVKFLIRDFGIHRVIETLLSHGPSSILYRNISMIRVRARAEGIGIWQSSLSKTWAFCTRSSSNTSCSSSIGAPRLAQLHVSPHLTQLKPSTSILEFC